MTKTVLLLLLVLSGTLCQAGHPRSLQSTTSSNQWWVKNFYQNWTRVYDISAKQNIIGITDYAFYFTILNKEKVSTTTMPQTATTTTNATTNNSSSNSSLPTTVTGIQSNNLRGSSNNANATTGMNMTNTTSSLPVLNMTNTTTTQPITNTTNTTNTQPIMNTTTTTTTTSSNQSVNTQQIDLAKYSFWWQNKNPKFDGESYMHFMPEGFKNGNGKILPIDGEVYLKFPFDGELFARPFDGELTERVFMGPYPVVDHNPNTTLYGLDGEVFHGSSSSSSNLDMELLSYRTVLMMYRDRLPIFNSKLSKNSNIKSQIMYVHVELFLLDDPVDYADPIAINEAFEIFISSTGDVTLRVAGYVSFLRAMEELAQLIHRDGTIERLPIYISDFPSFPWRSVKLDVATNFIPIYDIKRVIHGMQINKLNVLNLHLVGTQAFPYQLVQFPMVTKMGAYSIKETYTREDLMDLIEYGQRRGVVVVAEIDLLVGTNSWTRSPEFADVNACGDIDPRYWVDFCSYPPCGQFDPTLDLTTLLVNSVLSEVQSIFPSRYIHLGGDQYNVNCWDHKPSIKQFMIQNNITQYDGLFDFFFNKANQFVGPDHHRIYYDIDSLQDLSYLQDGILEYFNASMDISNVQNLTNPIILSQYDELYLTCSHRLFSEQLELLSNPNGPLCEEDKTWFQVYNFSIPTDMLGNRILGATVSVWSTNVNGNNLDQVLFPRASALGLRLWNNDQIFKTFDLVQRLSLLNYHLGLWEVLPTPVTDQYCAMHVDECFSNYSLKDLNITQPKK